MPPRPDPTRFYAALAALVIALLLAWLLPALLTLTPRERDVLPVAFVTLGLVAAVAILWFLRPTLAPVAAPDDTRDDALVTIDAARARLPRGALHASPLVLLLGVEGSDTTSVVTRSGLDPELLAGDAVGSDPIPTANANVWKVGGAVLVEAGAPLLADTERWRRFARALRAPRVAAAMGRGEAAPRAAVACVSCALFYDGGGTQLDAVAQLLRQRLSEVANDWGVALPVYVVFTQADVVPHFEAWAAPLTRDEARAPLGAALPFHSSPGAAGSYAERLVPRVEAAFREIAESLAGWRLTLLGRESVAERRFAAYELPRELGKLAPAATRFLAELCRPTQLGTSPTLRGFYFVGVRPVVVGDVAAPLQMAASAPASARATDATGVFSSLGAPPAAAAPAGYAMPSARRVAQWAFLDRLFPEVVLADSGAAVAARGGTRVSGLRRGLLAAGIAAMLIAGAGVARSWVGNRALVTRTADAARAVAALPIGAASGVVSFPPVETLASLDALRALLDTVRAHERDGPPWRLRWGLWRGADVLADGRRTWLAAYRQHLHEPSWTALVDSLRTLPAAPGPSDDYARTYADLRAYLVTTDEWRRSSVPSVAPVLARSWTRGGTPPAAVAELAERQFAFYAAALSEGNPFPRAADPGLVQRARAFLSGFGGTERIYQAKVADASQRFAAARLAILAPQAPGVVSVPGDVPGAFTAASWAFMDSTFRDTSVVVQGDAWVVGEVSAAQMPDRASMLADLQTRYRQEYVERWRAFVRGAAVVRASDPRDAAGKLGVIRGAQSPLLAVLALTARNTAVDSGMSLAFQPAHHVSPPALTDKLVSEQSQPYLSALDNLLGALEQVANMPPPSDTVSARSLAQAASQVLMVQVASAKTAARELARGFATDSAAAAVGPAVEALLLAPIESAERPLQERARVQPPAAVVASGGGSGEPPQVLMRRLNERAAGLCVAMRPVLEKFPFAPDSRADASVGEVAELLAPNTGQLWLLYQDRLGGLLKKQGSEWVPDPASPVPLSASFVAFFNRAARASEALFQAGGSTPLLRVTAQGAVSERVPAIVLANGSQSARFERNSSPAQLTWPASGPAAARLTAAFEQRFRRDPNQTVSEGRGDWALFHLAAKARWKGTGSTRTAEWSSRGRTVAVDFTFPTGAPVLVRGWLGEMGCTAQATR